MNYSTGLLPALLDECAKLNYPVFDAGRNFNLNIFGIRNTEYATDRFDDIIGVWCRVQTQWRLWMWAGTTDPGKAARISPTHSGGVAILRDIFHSGLWELGYHHQDYQALTQRPTAIASVVRDNDRDWVLNFDGTPTTATGINLHCASAVTMSQSVGRWSEGCQVIQSKGDHDELMWLANQQVAAGMTPVYSYKLFRLSRSPGLRPMFPSTKGLRP